MAVVQASQALNSVLSEFQSDYINGMAEALGNNSSIGWNELKQAGLDAILRGIRTNPSSLNANFARDTALQGELLTYTDANWPNGLEQMVKKHAALAQQTLTLASSPTLQTVVAPSGPVSQPNGPKQPIVPLSQPLGTMQFQTVPQQPQLDSSWTPIIQVLDQALDRRVRSYSHNPKFSGLGADEFAQAAVTDFIGDLHTNRSFFGNFLNPPVVPTDQEVQILAQLYSSGRGRQVLGVALGDELDRSHKKFMEGSMRSEDYSRLYLLAQDVLGTDVVEQVGDKDKILTRVIEGKTRFDDDVEKRLAMLVADHVPTHRSKFLWVIPKGRIKEEERSQMIRDINNSVEAYVTQLSLQDVQFNKVIHEQRGQRRNIGLQMAQHNSSNITDASQDSVGSEVNKLNAIQDTTDQVLQADQRRHVSKGNIKSQIEQLCQTHFDNYHIDPKQRAKIVDKIAKATYEAAVVISDHAKATKQQSQAYQEVAGGKAPGRLPSGTFRQ